MKKMRYVMLLGMLLLLGGCASEASAPQAEPDAAIYTQSGDMPVLSIATVNQKEDALDFVTEPVNGYVSKLIASWTPGYKIPPTPYYEACTVTLKAGEDTVLLDAAEAEVKVRGNWTTSYDKKPLRVKFTEKQTLLGLNGSAEMRNWVLMAEYKDTSMLRNKTVLSIARELLGEDGLYAADAAFVEVEVNGQYWGVYLLAEMQQVNADRVAVTKPKQGYTGTDIGYFMEFDGYYTNEDKLHRFKVNYADNAPLVPYDGKDGSGRTITPLKTKKERRRDNVGITIKSIVNSQEQHDFIASYVNNVYEILYRAAYEDAAYVFNADYTDIKKADITPREAVEQAVNVNSLADMYIISELTCDADIYWSSFFMDVDFGEGGDRRLTFEAPWDFDSSMGLRDRCEDGTGFYAANIVPDVNDVYETVNPWLAVLIYEDWFQALVKEKWTAAYDDGIFERAASMLRNDAERYQEAFSRNYDRWDNLLHNSAAMDMRPEVAGFRTHAEAVDYLAEWLNSRVVFLNEHWHLP